MTSRTTEDVNAFLSEWTGAERAGDTEKLATLLTDDFYGVGPLGFVLPRPAWLDRHRGGLAYEHFGLEEILVRLHGDVAIVTARNSTGGTYQGQPIPEAVRATLVVVSGSQALRLAAVHTSFIAGARGSPPMPEPKGTPGRGAHAPADGHGR